MCFDFTHSQDRQALVVVGKHDGTIVEVGNSLCLLIRNIILISKTKGVFSTVPLVHSTTRAGALQEKTLFTTPCPYTKTTSAPSFAGQRCFKHFTAGALE